MMITTEIDGGAVEVLDDSAPALVRLALRADLAAEFRQWFCFRVEDAEVGERLGFVLENAGEATYADAFEGYRACASYDGERWFRVPTAFDGAALRFEHTPDEPAITYAYFAAYPWERHQALVERAEASPFASVEALGETLEGRPVELITIDDGERVDDERLNVWVIARQHPGESMAAWFAEGLVERLLDPDDEVAADARARARFFIVPTMNPDGGVLGNLRTNAAGENLNRAWEEPTAERTPEVFHVRAAMEERGVDLFLDVHGDERNPYCFLAGCEGNPSYGERLRFLENLFEQTLVAANTDFQDEYGYPRDEPGGGDLRTAGNWVGERFDCLSFTLEMPFKDNAKDPDPWAGWSPERSRGLGAATLDAVVACLDSLRGELDEA
jgi:murein tripeptide amidase MpaA